MINLLSNSLKYTFKGGVVVKLSSDVDENVLIVSVTDTGIGIDQIILENLND